MGNKHSGKVSSEESLKEIKPSDLYITKSPGKTHTDEETVKNTVMSTRSEDDMNNEIDNLVIASPELRNDEQGEAGRKVKLTYLSNDAAKAIYPTSRSFSDASFKTVQFGSVVSVKSDEHHDVNLDDCNSSDSAYHSYANHNKENSPTRSPINANPILLEGKKKESNDYVHNAVDGIKEMMVTPNKKSNDYFRRPSINPLPTEFDSDSGSLMNDLSGLPSFNSISFNDETAEYNSNAILPENHINNVIDCQYDADQTGYLQLDHAICTNHEVVCVGPDSSKSNCERNGCSNMGINTSSNIVKSRPPTGGAAAESMDIVAVKTVSSEQRRQSLKRKKSQNKIDNENNNKFEQNGSNLSSPHISLNDCDSDSDKLSKGIQDSSISLRSRTSSSSPKAKYPLLSSDNSCHSAGRIPVTPSQVHVDDNDQNDEIEKLISEELHKTKDSEIMKDDRKQNELDKKEILSEDTNSTTESCSTVHTVNDPKKLEDMDFLTLLKHLRRDTAPYAPKDYKPPTELCKKKKKKRIVVST